MIVRDRPTGRVLRAFAESVEAWSLQTTQGGRIGCDVEELIAVGNKTFEAIVDLDAHLNAAMFERGTAPDADVSREIETLYRTWADTAVLMVKGLPGCQSEAFDTLVRNLDLATSPGTHF